MSGGPLLFPCTHAADDPERATVPFILAATAAVSGHRAIVVCSIEGAWMATDRIVEAEDPDLPPVTDLRQQLLAAGGEVWCCSACAVKRGLTQDDLAEGCVIVGAATIIAALAEGKAMNAA